MNIEKFNTLLKEFRINKKILLLLFGLMCAVQLAIPLYTIWFNEKAIYTGVAYKFRVEPIDPTDPFRGNFVVLRYKDVAFKMDHQFKGVEDVKVSLTTDSLGYAQISDITRDKPDNENYVNAKTISYKTTKNEVVVKYPFNRFYMHENKSRPAEVIYSKYVGDSSSVAYAIVYVKDGEAIVTDVKINEISLTEIEKFTY